MATFCDILTDLYSRGEVERICRGATGITGQNLQDLTGEVVLRVLERKPRRTNPQSVAAYIAVIARRMAMDENYPYYRLITNYERRKATITSREEVTPEPYIARPAPTLAEYCGGVPAECLYADGTDVRPRCGTTLTTDGGRVEYPCCIRRNGKRGQDGGTAEHIQDNGIEND